MAVGWTRKEEFARYSGQRAPRLTGWGVWESKRNPRWAWGAARGTRTKAGVTVPHRKQAGHFPAGLGKFPSLVVWPRIASQFLGSGEEDLEPHPAAGCPEMQPEASNQNISHCLFLSCSEKRKNWQWRKLQSWALTRQSTCCGNWVAHLPPTQHELSLMWACFLSNSFCFQLILCD